VITNKIATLCVKKRVYSLSLKRAGKIEEYNTNFLKRIRKREMSSFRHSPEVSG